jgi:hypothetical protein
MKLYYENSEGTTLDLSGFPYLLTFTDAYGYAWEVESAALGNNKSKVQKFKRNSKQLSASIAISSRYRTDFTRYMDDFFSTVEVDVVANKPGKLITENGEYMQCYIVESENNRINPLMRLNERNVTIMSPYPFWITEATKHFQPVGREEIESDYLDYPYDYNYDYSYETPGIRTWNLDHYATSEFKMTIYGYCENPRILINGYPYQIFGTVEENEFLVIDSKNKTVTHYLNNGTTENWFDFRNKENSVFEPLPSGNLTLTWDGTYGFDILAYLERSEPKWT